ncbi:MAG: hypothetical protein Q4P29_06535 [Tissierellia bacterium]|nr:hypothetical protein [Tissierellia bacterium]
MIKFILGAKGSGKTKWLIDNANKDMKEGNGNIAFIDVDDNHIFSLDYNVRLINASEYKIDNVESLYGFLCGLLGMDYDLEKIYVDSIYKIIDLSIEDLEDLKKRLTEISNAVNADFYINVDYTLDEVPDSIKECAEETSEEF